MSITSFYFAVRPRAGAPFGSEPQGRRHGRGAPLRETVPSDTPGKIPHKQGNCSMENSPASSPNPGYCPCIPYALNRIDKVVKSPLLSLRGAERRGNLAFSSTYKGRDCFTSFAMTRAPGLFTRPSNFFYLLLPFMHRFC